MLLRNLAYPDELHFLYPDARPRNCQSFRRHADWLSFRRAFLHRYGVEKGFGFSYELARFWVNHDVDLVHQPMLQSLLHNNEDEDGEFQRFESWRATFRSRAAAFPRRETGQDAELLHEWGQRYTERQDHVYALSVIKGPSALGRTAWISNEIDIFVGSDPDLRNYNPYLSRAILVSEE